MSLLLPQEVRGVVRSARAVEIHGDRYVDVVIAIADQPDRPRSGRVPASDCPPDLTPGETISARFVMGVMVSVKRPQD